MYYWIRSWPKYLAGCIWGEVSFLVQETIWCQLFPLKHLNRTIVSEAYQAEI